MKVEWMRGCATALVTPYGAGGGVDVERMRALVRRQMGEGGARRGVGVERVPALGRRQMDEGVSLLVPCGTTGESVTMSAEEREQVIRATIDAARGRARVIAGTGSNNTAHAVEQSREAAGWGADAVLVVAPYYNKPTQEGLYQHFRAVAEAVPETPVVLYNVPGRTSSNIAAETALRLARD